MIGIVLREPLTVVGPAHAFIMAAGPWLLPILARFASDEGRAEDAPRVWREVHAALSGSARPLPGVRETVIVCDASTNPESVVASRRVGVGVAMDFSGYGSFSARARLLAVTSITLEVDFRHRAASNESALDPERPGFRPGQLAGLWAKMPLSKIMACLTCGAVYPAADASCGNGCPPNRDR